MLLSALYLRFRDVHHIWGLAGSGAVLCHPDLLRCCQLSGRCWTPTRLAAIFTEFRHAVLDPHAPSLTAAGGGVAGALVPVAAALLIFTLGIWVFHRESPNAPENVKVVHSETGM